MLLLRMLAKTRMCVVVVSVPFMRHIEPSFEVILPLLEHASSDIRKGAVHGVSQLCIAVAKVAAETGDNQAQAGQSAAILQATLRLRFSTVSLRI